MVEYYSFSKISKNGCIKRILSIKMHLKFNILFERDSSSIILFFLVKRILKCF
jgi:hypothetical protein